MADAVRCRRKLNGCHERPRQAAYHDPLPARSCKVQASRANMRARWGRNRSPARQATRSLRVRATSACHCTGLQLRKPITLTTRPSADEVSVTSARTVIGGTLLTAAMASATRALPPKKSMPFRNQRSCTQCVVVRIVPPNLSRPAVDTTDIAEQQGALVAATARSAANDPSYRPKDPDSMPLQLTSTLRSSNRPGDRHAADSHVGSAPTVQSPPPT